MKNKKIWIRERHYSDDQMICYATYTMLIPGSIQTKELPNKLHETKSKDQESAFSIAEIRQNLLEPLESLVITDRYKSQEELKRHITSLKFPILENRFSCLF